MSSKLKVADANVISGFCKIIIVFYEFAPSSKGSQCPYKGSNREMHIYDAREHFDRLCCKISHSQNSK